MSPERHSENGSYQEILARLDALKAPIIPLIDPTANVLKLVEQAVLRLNDLRDAENRRLDDLWKLEHLWADKLAAERMRSDMEAKRAEAGRIDALLGANTNNVALALEKQGAQATAQDRRISVLEQNQYQTGGRDIQRDVAKVDVAKWVGWFLAGLGIAWAILKPK